MAPSPSFPYDPRKVDEMLSKELTQMSVHERDRVYEEIHGVASLCPEETPELVQTSLNEMELEVEAWKRHQTSHQDLPFHRASIDLVNGLPPHSYILQKQDFWLRLLRCELFDAKKAAIRLFRFVEFMHEQYGPAVLERPLQMSDLAEIDNPDVKGKDIMECMKAGHTQLLPFRDRSGRRIIATTMRLALTYDMSVRYKFCTYLYWLASTDVESQQKGLVLVLWAYGKSMPFPSRNSDVSWRRMFEAIPTRIATIHFCFEDGPSTRITRAICILAMRTNNKIRVQCHSKDEWEARYKLMGFGIPIDLLPLTDTGNVKNKNWTQWIKGRKTIESKKIFEPQEYVECPLSKDVVYKPGTSSVSHPGNVMFRNLLEVTYQEYLDSPNHAGKQAVVNRILDEIYEHQGRFLEWDPRGCCWVVISEPQVRTKIANSLLYFNRSIKAKQNLQTNISSTYMFERQDGKKRKRDDSGEEPGGCGRCM